MLAEGERELVRGVLQGRAVARVGAHEVGVRTGRSRQQEQQGPHDSEDGHQAWSATRAHHYTTGMWCSSWDRYCTVIISPGRMADAVFWYTK